MREIKPRLIFWEITKSCNLGCEHCRAQAGNNRSPHELSPDEIKRVLRQIASFSAPIMVFSGGEPLVREDIYELIRYAAELGLRPAVATNATLITKETVARLKKNNIGMAAVSIYGPDAEAHDRFCGKEGAFDQTLKGIENLKKANIPFQVNTTITKRNLDQLERIGDFALKQGAVAYHVFFLVPTGRGKSIKGDEISPQEYENAFNRLYDLQKNFPLRLRATCAPHYYRVFRQRAAKEGDRINRENSKGCLAGQGVCFISHEGEVFGCGYLPVAAGNLRSQDFENIWNKSDLFKVLRDEANLIGKCGVCEFKKVCGGCRARAYAATGNYLKEEPECVYQPKTV